MYLQILRLDPRDRRVRQKVGEIYLRQGKNADAERHLREVVDSLLKEGSHRAAVSVLKQLAGLRPDDPQIHSDLGECYLAGGYHSDARAALDAAVRGWVSLGKPLLAAKPARRVADSAPGDVTLRLRVGELLQSGGDNAGALDAFQEVIDEFRRRGRLDEVGRVAEIALALKPDDVGLLLDAAHARIAAGDCKRALQALQPAFAAAPREPRTLDLLARAFEGSGQPDRALKVLVELSRLAAERAEIKGEVEALRRAAALAPDDEDIRSRLVNAEDRLGRLEQKLTGMAFAQPVDEEELRVVVRAEVLARYGLVDRAESEVREALSARGDSVALIAGLAEVLVSAGRSVEAMPWMERLLPRAGAEAEAVIDRMALIRGMPAAAGLDEELLEEDDLAPEPDDGSLLPPENDEQPDAGEGPEAEGDRLARRGDFAGALLAWRRALADDPLNEGVLAKIAELRSAARSAPPEPAPAAARPSEGTFAEVEPAALDEVSPEGGVEEARALAAVGQGEAALQIVRDLPGLEARIVEAQARRAQSDLSGALEVLREATNDASESDPAYPEALFDLAGLYTATQKHRSALRLLEELRDLAPEFRSAEVESRLRGLQLLAR
ncbi:MAG: tetratricopeptide repeat protein [Deltaproteobacteria bacterium]|nr:tetratricopeptide repeat protein [Deltaproteobacteria bacterium]